jgi:putative transcriptional regulator
MSMPQMKDPNFSGTLTYICEHNEQGAMGIIINRPADFGLSDILDQLDISPINSEQAVYFGGPVQQDTGFILHDGEQTWESTIDVSSKLKLTTSKDILMAIAKDQGPKRSLIALGYAGWGGGQLEDELAENTWLCCPASDSIIFLPENDKKLSLAMKSMGIDLDQLNGQVGHA